MEGRPSRAPRGPFAVAAHIEDYGELEQLISDPLLYQLPMPGRLGARSPSTKRSLSGGFRM
jgi:hypothetical protein